MAYIPNFKWSVGDVDRVVKMARKGKTATEISEELADTSLASTPAEILHLCLNVQCSVRLGANRSIGKVAR